ncbi:hypothetical protein HU200_022529 [Digitaria exilis]|uniref:Uncharacterized protein n=1 Tax=Digitaria exilis TaxID=1010633 RepID=A0A835EXA9_9POAL|nr:hypothetical protein HU200_022529 [Digitaria exilis]
MDLAQTGFGVPPPLSSGRCWVVKPSASDSRGLAGRRAPRRRTDTPLGLPRRHGRGKGAAGAPERQPGKNLIKIPSYQEVFGTGSTSSSSTPPSYNPPLPSAGTPAASTSSSSSGSFSQAFSFLKSSEFYSPPPPPPPQPPPPRGMHTPPHLLVLNPCGSGLDSDGFGFAGAGRLRLAPPWRCPRARSPFSSVIGSIRFESKLSEQTIPSCSLEECGRYLETIKVYENKPADNIVKRWIMTIYHGYVMLPRHTLARNRNKLGVCTIFIYSFCDIVLQFTHALTSIRHVNKTDVVTLGSSFGVKRLHDTFHEPFKRVSVRRNFVVPDTPDREKASGQPSSMNDSFRKYSREIGGIQEQKGFRCKVSPYCCLCQVFREKIRSQSSEAANEAGEGASSSNREEAKTKD